MRRSDAALLRALALPRAERAFMLEAALALFVASAKTRLLPFRRIAETAGRPGADGPGDLDLARRCASAVRRVARYAPFRAVCLQQSLALHAMLARRAMPSRLHFGLRRKNDASLSAHVWLSLEGRILIGEVEERYSELAAFPADSKTPDPRP